MRRPAKRVAGALALASAILVGAIAVADQSGSPATAPPTPPKPAAVQARAQFEALATRYYMVIPGSSRPAS